MTSTDKPDNPPGCGLGIDAGGTATRWALAGADGALLGQGEVGGLSALQMTSPDGRAGLLAEFARMAQAVHACGRPRQVVAGLTGFGGDSQAVAHLLAEALGAAPAAIIVGNDVEIAYRANLGPGEGYLVLAGTGSIGAWIDAGGQFHRAGGRGVILDDGGGGFAIARAAMRHIWRGEDELPGSWKASPMAQAVFAQIGSSEWDASRHFMYAQERGAVGRLALAVAASAETDPVAMAILREAGQELARLATALIARFGPRPVVLAGRAAGLHPAIVDAMRAALPPTITLTQSEVAAHVAAARLAAKAL